MATSILRIEGARVNNLKNITVSFPHGHLVVITGVSGSGKSSLAFDTLYAEGQRRYVESLSSYARQFLGKIEKPEVDDIKGLAPAIAIQQKVISRNPRSTVGTVTEIHDYLKVLFARVGTTFSPVTNQEVKRHDVRDVLDALERAGEDARMLVVAPIDFKDRSPAEMRKLLMQQGYSRVLVDLQTVTLLEDAPDRPFELVVDRLNGGERDEDAEIRAADSVQTAFFEGHGTCILQDSNGHRHHFSNTFSEGDLVFEEPSPAFFSFNTPQGACPTCEGFGSVLGIDPELVIPNPGLSVYEDAIAPWKGERLSEWKDQLVLGAEKAGFPIHSPIVKLSPEHLALLWDGCEHFEGLNSFFTYVESKAYKIQYRVLQARYRGKTVCSDCRGSRLRTETNYVKIGGCSIGEISMWSIRQAREWFENLKLTPQQAKIAERLLTEINRRLSVLEKVGLHYLSLDRPASTLSGGESQRIHLATSLGSSLVGSLYILDEPSIGLHARDAEDLLGVLKELRDQGNTVVVVEHDALFMNAADTLIDIGPGAGSLGGEIVFFGSGQAVKTTQTLTAQYLNGSLSIQRNGRAINKENDWIALKGARINNLQSVNIELPLNRLSAICGVSGSGKTSLIRHVLVPALQKYLGEYAGRGGYYESLTGALSKIKQIELVDQNPIGKSSRSNPVTYLKVYDDIRALFAAQKHAQIHGFQAKHFSFNTDGGRCEVCKGDGYVTIEMQFMADVHLVCEQCQGKRFQDDVLEVCVSGKSIADVLQMTIADAQHFFTSIQELKIAKKLQPLLDVGLGYLQMGQSSSTLSGGEGQRVKLASFLAKGQGADPVFFVFDEPTTGLHFDDVAKLLKAFDALIDLGHSILVIEHQTDVLKHADWLIELGPGGGAEGGHLVYQGLPSGIISEANSATRPFLA
jgi:excinuclease ABC subunit A